MAEHRTFRLLGDRIMLLPDRERTEALYRAGAGKVVFPTNARFPLVVAEIVEVGTRACAEFAVGDRLLIAPHLGLEWRHARGVCRIVDGAEHLAVGKYNGD